MSFSYLLLTFVVLLGLPATFWALHQFILNVYLYKMKKTLIILIHSGIALLFTLLSWFFPFLGWLCFILSLGLEFLVVYLVFKKSPLSKIMGS